MFGGDAVARVEVVGVLGGFAAHQTSREVREGVIGEQMNGFGPYTVDPTFVVLAVVFLFGCGVPQELVGQTPHHQPLETLAGRTDSQDPRDDTTDL